MASVSSLDQDMRNLRLSRYTPSAAQEVRVWIEETLGERLPPGDLLDVLKDGVALCKLANLALPPPRVKYKSSSMPFIQMENISHFLKACEMPPLNMPAHDRFLTVDLYESKDPAQVLQCLGAFSRQAHAASPARFRTTIGPKQAGGTMSPTGTGSNGGSFWSSAYGRPPSPVKPSAAMPSASRALSPSLTGGSNGSQSSAVTSPGPTSSWSSRKDEGVTSPAWNIHQYGYMGGASQGNQGISFGARRQITSQAPAVPSLADKERKRKEKAAEDERLRQQAEEAEHRRRAEREAEEDRERVEEERRWEDETRKQREEERRRVEEQKRQWEEQERRWKEEEEVRRKEAESMQKSLMPKKPPERPRVSSSSILRGQSLAQYQREQAALAHDTDGSMEETPEQRRVRELEQQLEEARERERQYQAEREERLRNGNDRGSRPSTAQTETPRPQSARESEASWAPDEREYLRQQWQSSRDGTPAKPAAPAQSVTSVSSPSPFKRPLPSEPKEPPSLPSRPLPPPTVEDEEQPEPEDELPTRPQPVQHTDSASSLSRLNDGASAPTSSPLGSANRPLPTPDKEFRAYVSPSDDRRGLANRTSQYLATHTPPKSASPHSRNSSMNGDAASDFAAREAVADRDRRLLAEKTEQYLATHPSPKQQQSSRFSASPNTSTAAPKKPSGAGKSLLEREMERERERQREWEANQEAIKSAPRDAKEGAGQGQTWDVNQYGYTGGDSMNRGSSSGSGIDFGGRRQILGPRSMGKK